MRYTLFTADNCHQCANVINYMNNNKIEFNLINVDRSDERPPVKIYAFPALFVDTELISYGSDINEYLQRNLN